MGEWGQIYFRGGSYRLSGNRAEAWRFYRWSCKYLTIVLMAAFRNLKRLIDFLLDESFQPPFFLCNGI